MVCNSSRRVNAKLVTAAPQLEAMGIPVNLEGNAEVIRKIMFPNGLNGESLITEKKVYPNDPCPCGSGKKYKKCCGKNK